MKEAEQILLGLKRRIFKPVYFLSGEEPYYIDQISDYIEKNVLEESEREFNQTIVYGKDVTLSAIVQQARQFPMMSDYQVVIVKEAQNIKELNKAAGSDAEEKRGSSSRQDDISVSGTQMLISYLKAPQPSTILVFCFKYRNIDKRGSVGKALQKHSVYFETKKLYDNQLPDWISNKVKELGCTIGPKAALLIAESLGNDLSKISNEIQKLLITAPKGSELSPELIQNNIGVSKDFNVYELQDALSKRDVLKANRIALYFAANPKENPIQKTLSLLSIWFGKILQYHFLQDKSKFAAAQALGVNPFFVESYARAASSFGVKKIALVFSQLRECDLKSKGVDNHGTDQGELLKELIYKILH